VGPFYRQLTNKLIKTQKQEGVAIVTVFFMASMVDTLRSPAVKSPTRPIAEVRVDMSSMGVVPPGRIKAAPVCNDASLKAQSMSTEELSKHCFPLQIPSGGSFEDLPEPSIVSSSSSTASRESNLSDFVASYKTTPLRLERRQSAQIAKVSARKVSRNGRECQRWFQDPSSQTLYRMVTGCVPIVEGGKILFVSASRKAEWILPKGGWEQDEDMEESAIRECFEEAGVVGILGPRLTEIEYETRKAKKRRMEFEELQRKTKTLRVAYSASPAPIKNSKEPVEGEAKVHLENVASIKDCLAPVSDEDFNRIRGQALKQCDETSSVVSDASHSHVRMNLFPMYVSEVKSSWPESGRFRKVVDIDEAIKMCESRPELQQALIEVKQRNLHLLPQVPII
jgi:diphosphoinositol-polyphosphate diphosphatase